jgi:ankyrin repeat protein
MIATLSLVELGSDTMATYIINHADATGLTAIHYASKHGHSRVIRQLHQGGASVSERDRQGKTPLQHAASVPLQ